MKCIYPELEGVLEVTGDELAIGVHFAAVPAGVGDHDGGDALDDGVVIGRHVNAEQSVEINHCVVLIYALVCASIAHKVLCTSRHFVPACQIHSFITKNKN